VRCRAQKWTGTHGWAGLGRRLMLSAACVQPRPRYTLTELTSNARRLTNALGQIVVIANAIPRAGVLGVRESPCGRPAPRQPLKLDSSFNAG
jgi:hypothetical protein